MTTHPDGPELREKVAQACRILAGKGLVSGILGHASARVADDEIVIRCRGPQERGLANSTIEDIWRVNLTGDHMDLPNGYSTPKELPLHTELFQARPELGAIVHAHPRSALLCGLAGIQPRAVFGAFDIPATRMALAGIPVYDRSVLISRSELAREMVEAMAGSDVCLLKGHGVTVCGESVEQATVRALTLNALYDVTLGLASLGSSPSEIDPRDLAELPDLGSAFNDRHAWNALVAELP